MALIILLVLGIRSLANASRARQFNPLNPSGVGWVPLPQTNMAAVVGRARSCVVGRARSCVVGRACVVGHAWSCAVGRAWSVVRGRACVVGNSWSFVVVRGRARSCVVVPFCPLRGQHCRDTNEGRNERTNERTTSSNNPLNPPGVGWVKNCYPINSFPHMPVLSSQ